MRLTIFDTETTGLPKKGYVLSPETLDGWPEIVQLSWIVYDTVTKKINEFDFILKVKEIPIETTLIHGITTSRSHMSGYPFEMILQIFQICVDTSDLIIAHNFSFDWDVIQAECLRRNISFTCATPSYCTKLATTKLCNLQKIGGGLKWPKLEELHYFLFKEKASNLHNAMIDVLVCFRCYMMIMHKEDICVTHKKLRNKFL